jgi:glucose/arabinose dehydrogenase
LLKGLDGVSDIEFLPNRCALISELIGRISVVDLSRKPPLLSSYISISDINTEGEKGLMDIALGPSFGGTGPLSKFVFVYYSRDSSKTFVIARFTHIEKGSLSYLDPASEFIVWEDSDLFPGPYHFGGQISFGPDGAIYLTQGDKTKSDGAQKVDALMLLLGFSCLCLSDDVDGWVFFFVRSNLIGLVQVYLRFLWFIIDPHADQN